MGELIALLFLAREWSHREHLKTTSYAEHKALDAFYHEIIEQADSLAETYQGKYSLRLDIPVMGNKLPSDITSALTAQLNWIQTKRYSAAPKEDTTIQNMIDEIIALYSSTLYMLSLK